MRALENKRKALRDAINYLCGPYLRQLTIMDLPDEILVKIAEHVKDWKPHKSWFSEYADRAGVKDVQELRLTCRRLYNTSSHLLLHFIRVGMDQASLAPLEEVASHPLISRGVVAIRVVLGFYHDVLANDISTFASYNANLWLDHTEDLDRLVESEHYSFVKIPRATMRERVKNMRSQIASWERFAAEGYPNELGSHEIPKDHIKLLQSAHEKYRSRFFEQERVKENGPFVRAVTAGVARMPFMKRMEVRNLDETSQPPGLLTILADTDELVQSLLFRRTWEDSILLQQLGSPPATMLLELFIAFHKEGILLADLDIKVSLPEHLNLLAPRDNDLPDLTAAMQRLKRLDFRPDCRWQDPWGPSEVETLCRFINPLLNTPSLEEIGLHFRFLGDEEDDESMPPYSLGSIITSRKWPRLHNISLDNMPVHLSQLRNLLYQINDPLWMSLENINLISGTWADTLDVLRERCQRAQVSFENPKGAELECWTTEHKDLLLAQPKGGKTAFNSGNLAERYIMGLVEENPMRLIDALMGEAE